MRWLVFLLAALLATALDLGLIGLFAYLSLMGYLLLRADEAARGPNALASRVAAGAGLALIGIHFFGVGDAVSLGAKVGLFQWLASGLILAAWQLQQSVSMGNPRELGDGGEQETSN